MLAAPIPADETARLTALYRLNILETPREQRFDKIIEKVKGYFNVPIALFSLVEKERQWIKSSIGLDVYESPRDISFCGHAIYKKSIFYVADAKADERFADNPLVTDYPKIGSYLGAPLYTENGYPVGVLCLIDHVPRIYTENDFTVLREFASLVETLFAEQSE